MFPKNAVYINRLNELILRLSASGLISKLNGELTWDMQRMGSGNLLQTPALKKFKITEVEERKLNLADTEGLIFSFGCLSLSILTEHFVRRHVPLDGHRLHSCR